MPLIVPVQPVPAQSLTVTLSNQNCLLNLYTEQEALFMDVLVDNALIIGGTICEDQNLIVRSAYLGFVGDFIFIDNSGQNTDPLWAGLGTQYNLVYMFPSDLPNLPAGVS